MEILGHAIEYLTDEAVCCCADQKGDPKSVLEASHILMLLNRDLYRSMPVVQPFWKKLMGRAATASTVLATESH